MIRWQDIQNILTTEDEINSLSGLTVTSSKLNILEGYLGDAADLNAAIGLSGSLTTHLSEDLATAHTLLEGSLDGLVITPNTIAEDRLSFDVATQAELDVLEVRVDDTVSDLNVQSERINNLYGIVFPGQSNDIAAAIQQCVDHIEDTKDAHDATAISCGESESGYYNLTSDLSSGSITTTLPLDIIRYFRTTDTIIFEDDLSMPESVTIDTINYNNGVITFSPAITTDFLLANNARVYNTDEQNVQEGLDRSLKNNTDIFTGRLTIDQNSVNHALVLDQSGSGDELHFTSGAIGADLDYNFYLDDTNVFNIIERSSSNPLFEVSTDGQGTLTTLGLREEGTSYTGTVDKQELTDDRTYILPNESGYIGVGDLSYSKLLKVSVDQSIGEINIAPGHTTNYDGEIVRAWVAMETGTEFSGENIDVVTQMTADGQIGGLGNNWIAFVVHLDAEDTLSYAYSTIQTTEEDAIDNIPYIPSIYMKLALIAVRGDGAGGINTDTLRVVEDLRPFLNIGMTNVYYDESIYYNSVLPAYTTVPLPLNSRANNVNQKYNVGAGQLEVYINDRFAEPSRDYNELTGSPVGQIAFRYDLPADTVVRFRIEHHSAGAPGTTGGAGSTSLHNAYLTGSAISTDSINGPVTIIDGTGGTNKAMVVDGDIDINGFVDPPTGYGLTPQPSEPGDLSATYHKLYADSNGELVYKKYDSGTSSFTNIIQEIKTASSSQGDDYYNITGATIPAYTVVALHPTTPRHIVLADVSTNSSTSRVIGITTEEIEHNQSGKIISNGRIVGAGLGFTHNHLLFADPSVSGGKVSESSLVLTPGNVSVILGTVDGDDLIVNINRNGEFSN